MAQEVETATRLERLDAVVSHTGHGRHGLTSLSSLRFTPTSRSVAASSSGEALVLRRSPSGRPVQDWQAQQAHDRVAAGEDAGLFPFRFHPLDLGSSQCWRTSPEQIEYIPHIDKNKQKNELRLVS